MRESSKYPINGICRFENFPEQSENNDFSKVLVGRVCGFDDYFVFDGWYVSLRKVVDGGNRYIYPYLHCPPMPIYKQLTICCFFSFLNKKPSVNSRRVTRFLLDPNQDPIGNYVKLEELLDEENGWLSDGTLCIEYGFCVESMEGLDGIWKFNFHDKLLDCDQKQNMITLYNDSWGSDECVRFYIHKQLLEFHLPYFKENNQTVHEFRYHYFPGFLELLQVTNGVNIRVRDLCYILDTVSIRFISMNVKRYCERQLIERQSSIGSLHYSFNMASTLNLNHFLADLLKDIKSGKQLAIILKNMEIENMSTEFMKQCTRYFIDNSNN